MRRYSLLLLGFVLLGALVQAQQIGVPWFVGWQGPFSGTTDSRGYFEIVVLRTSTATHAITGELYNAATQGPIANSPVSIRYYAGLAQGTRVEISVPGYTKVEARVKTMASSWTATGAYTTYDVGPVYLSGTQAPPGRLELNPIQDATIAGDQYQRVNYGSEPDLIVCPAYPGPPSGYGGPEHRFLIQFDLSQIPSGVQIASAALRLCVWEFHGDELVVAVHPITRAWDESTVTWSSHCNAYDFATLIDRPTLKNLQMGDWVEFSVTEAVRKALATGARHYGWMIIPINLSYMKFTQAKFYSREGGAPNPYAAPGTPLASDRRPVLVVEFGQVTPAPPIIDKTMCKDVQMTSPYDAIDRTSTFSVNDRQAVAWVKFGPVKDRHRVEFHWYYLDDPAGPSRVHIFRYDIPDPGTRGQAQWDWYVVWSVFRIRGTLFTRVPKPAHWEVRIYVDGQYRTSLYFTLE